MLAKPRQEQFDPSCQRGRGTIPVEDCWVVEITPVTTRTNE
jgi:hypothetical protein